MAQAENGLLAKRVFDIALTVPTLILLSPLLALLAWLVRLNLGSPVFFRQQRPGLNEQPFTLLKFRTMSDDRDVLRRLLPDSARLTRFGRLLRRSSLDELPELLNVLKGEMSLVGPRPLLMRYLPYYTEQERTRFKVLPGITGWAQINGRNDLPWDNRLACDAWYVENRSLVLDIKILCQTALVVLQAKNVYLVPNLTMPDLDEVRSEKSNAGKCRSNSRANAPMRGG